MDVKLNHMFVLFALACLFTCCVAPQCFSCTQREQGCGDHFGLPITAASFCEGTCKKMRGERYSNEVRLVEVTRMCVGQTDEGCSDEVWNGISVIACTCNSDYCNTGNPSVSTLGQLSLLAAVWLVHKLCCLC